DAILPVRFGSLLSESSLADLLAARAPELSEALALVSGREQMTLRVLGDARAAVETPRDDAGADALGPGARYMAARRAEWRRSRRRRSDDARAREVTPGIAACARARVAARRARAARRRVLAAALERRSRGRAALGRAPRAHPRRIPAAIARASGDPPHGGWDAHAGGDRGRRPRAHASGRNDPRHRHALRPGAGGAQSRHRPPGPPALHRIRGARSWH